MNKSPFSFQPPAKFNSSKFNSLNSKDMLFNKKKISSDVLSMSSGSSSSGSSSASSGSSSGHYANRRDDDYMSKKYREQEEAEDDETDNSDDSDGSDGSEDSDDDNTERSSSSSASRGSNNIVETSDKYANVQRDKKKQMMNEFNEKRELLYQMDRLESKGYKLPFKFNMESDLNEMRQEYNKLIREKEIDASVRFQRKMLMAFVTGAEYMNSRYDPFAIRLEGWSEQVHETIMDYDDIFEELHTKYKSTGKKMSPELRLLISLSGSAFMFHLTNRMFKESPLPNVEQVLKSNPELMKQFQQAAAKQYINGNVGGEPSGYNSGPGNSGLFGMVSSLFNNISGGSARSGPPMPTMSSRDDDEMSNSSLRNYRRKNKPSSSNDIDNIISNVHSKISLDHNDNNNIETLSISDEEITSIIEDTADIKILRNSKKNGSRTLNL